MGDDTTSDDKETDGEDPPGKGSYVVGYGKPPAEYRFKKGQSGNPRGRPRKAKAPKPDRSFVVLSPPMRFFLRRRIVP